MTYKILKVIVTKTLYDSNETEIIKTLCNKIAFNGMLDNDNLINFVIICAKQQFLTVENISQFINILELIDSWINMFVISPNKIESSKLLLTILQQSFISKLISLENIQKWIQILWDYQYQLEENGIKMIQFFVERASECITNVVAGMHIFFLFHFFHYWANVVILFVPFVCVYTDAMITNQINDIFSQKFKQYINIVTKNAKIISISSFHSLFEALESLWNFLQTQCQLQQQTSQSFTNHSSFLQIKTFKVEIVTMVLKLCENNLVELPNGIENIIEQWIKTTSVKDIYETMSTNR